MDAKPQRPLRAFPAAQPQRDENQPMNAISNKPKNMDVQLAHPQNAIIGTIKGNAKRSAFGDLSNTTTTTGANANQRVPTNGLAKQAVIAAKPAVKMIPYNDNKENAVKDGVRKDAFLRPAQRPSNTQKASAAPASQPAVKLAGTRKATMVYSDQYQPRVPGLSRQYRSQPQLKSTEPPVLRRSHSKHILQNVRTNNADDDIDEASYEDAMEQQSCEEQTDVSAWMPAPGPMGPPVAAEMEPLQPAPALAPAPMHPLPSGPVDTQPEEYWEDDEAEEWYDDYGYSTAHSYKSHGDTTTGAITLNAPKKTARVQRELEHARCYVESTRSSEDTDEEEWDISMVAEYSEEIFEYMRELEERMLPDSHYMDTVQCEIQWSMRSILMDWLVQVHNRFALLPETLFLTVNYIDRFLSSKMVSLGKLQLVGATAIFVAAKYEEINCPSVQEIVFMVDGGYTVDEILKAERFMLSMLQFELGWPGPMSFLRRISKADDYDLETRTLAKYFLEVTIMDERFVGCPPSYLAAGAHCLARLILKKGDWSLAHIHYSGYTWAQLKPLVAMVLECCRSPQKHHSAVYEKYSDRRFKRSSIFVEQELAKGFKLPFNNSIPRFSLPHTMDDQSAPIRFPPPESSSVLITTES